MQPEVAIMSVMMLDPTNIMTDMNDMTFISYSLFPHLSSAHRWGTNTWQQRLYVQSRWRDAESAGSELMSSVDEKGDKVRESERGRGKQRVQVESA